MTDLVLNFFGNGCIFLEELGGIRFTLAYLVPFIGVPGARLIDEVELYTPINHLAHVVDASAVHDLELRLTEWWRDFVLHDLDAGFVTHHFVALFDRPDTSDIQSHRRVELECITTSGGLGAAKHDADLHTDLIDKEHRRLAAINVAGEFTKSL